MTTMFYVFLTCGMRVIYQPVTYIYVLFELN
jgi:hypothetical protein